MKIGFSTSHRSFISKMIIFFTRSNQHKKPYISHAFPILGEMDGIELALSADEVMVNIVPVNKYRTGNHTLRIYRLPDEFNRWQNLAIKKYHKKIYPHFELLWFIYRWVRRKINPTWKGTNPINYSSQCAELTIETIKLAGYDIFLDSNSSDAMELEAWVALHGYLIEERRGKHVAPLD